MTDRRQMEAVAEAILFVATEPVSRDKLLQVFSETEREEAEAAIDAVVKRYQEDPNRGVIIDAAGSGLRLVSRPDLHGYLRRFFEITGTNKLTMAALEALAIIAYRQPITNPEIQELRSVNSAGVLKTLLERRLIRIAGRKEVVGKPFLYATTREFLERFGLRSLKELPSLEQFEELMGGEDEAGGEAPAEGVTAVDEEEEILRRAAEVEEAEAESEGVEEAAEPEEAEEIEEVGQVGQVGQVRQDAEETEEAEGSEDVRRDAEVEDSEEAEESTEAKEAEEVGQVRQVRQVEEPEQAEPQP